MIPVDGSPRTRASLREDLLRLGVRPDTLLIVHSSLKSIGFVVGGAPTVVRAFLDVLGDGGTLVMPAATPLCADPASWPGPRVPEEWLAEVREHLPIFDRATTPTTMGAIPETFRSWPGTLRSDHPLESICARGPLAAELTAPHPLDYAEGPDGPFGRIFERDGRILLLGVGFNRCTALHFAESLVERRRVQRTRCPILEEGRRVWKELENVGDDLDTHFPVLGARYLREVGADRGLVGAAESIFVPMRSLVDFGVRYFRATDPRGFP